MGGTSADIGTIQGGQERYLSEFQVGFGIPISVTCVDVATLGAGGGSIAWIDKGGLLQVGPRSAGADPGPMCYGKGGTEPTTTDANLVLGRLNPVYFLGGQIALDPEAPRNRAWRDRASRSARSQVRRSRSRRTLSSRPLTRTWPTRSS